jgi:SAM-dependent methyltransferase
MGLGAAFLTDLAELKRSGELDGARRVVEIGAQQLADSLIQSAALVETCRLFGSVKPLLLTPVGTKRFAAAAPFSETFWSALGFEHTAIDIDGPAVHLDLNRDSVPNELRGTFDLVINAGTTEHLANQENAFRVIHDLVRAGGLMYHEVPAGGLIDHGFFSYQPKFFFWLCEQNDYKLVRLTMTESAPSPVPAYVRNLNRRFGGAMPENVPDWTLRVALRKRWDRPFFTPVDAPARLIPLSHLSLGGRLRRTLARIRRAVAMGRAIPW